jgi:hypothetical protein
LCTLKLFGGGLGMRLRLSKAGTLMKAYQFIVAGLIGAAAIAGIGFLVSRGQAARLEGAITNIRTLGSDETSAVAIVDFEAANPSQILLIVGDRDLLVVDGQGMQHEGSTISAADLKMLFQYFPALGSLENEPLIDRVRVEPGRGLRGVVAARFEIPKHRLDARQELILRIKDVDGGISELRASQKPPAASQ